MLGESMESAWWGRKPIIMIGILGLVVEILMLNFENLHYLIVIKCVLIKWELFNFLSSRWLKNVVYQHPQFNFWPLTLIKQDFFSWIFEIMRNWDFWLILFLFDGRLLAYTGSENMNFFLQAKRWTLLN